MNALEPTHMPNLFSPEEESTSSRLSRQVTSFFVHAVIALLVWGAIIAIGYVMDPPSIQSSSDPFWHLILLGISLFVPLLAGSIVNRFQQNEMAGSIWLLGLIWVLIVSLWVLDMPTGPNQCYQCDATEKLVRTFFSLPRPSGLIDNDGPFVCTWPAAALLGYAIGAQMALKKKVQD